MVLQICIFFRGGFKRPGRRPSLGLIFEFLPYIRILAWLAPLGVRESTDIPRFLILYESFRSTDLKKKKKNLTPLLCCPFTVFLSKNRLFVGQFFHFFGAGQNDLFTLINKSLSFNYSSPTDISKKKFDF